MTPMNEDEQITGYILGELDPAQRAAFEARLARDEALRMTVNEFRVVAAKVTLAVKAEDAPRLTIEQRNVIERNIGEIAGGAAPAPRRHAPGVRRLIWMTMVAALVVIGVCALKYSQLLSSRSDERSRIAAAKSLIERISSALGQYQSDLKELPPDTGYGLSFTDPASGKTFDAGSLWRYLAKKTIHDGKSYGPYLQFSSAELAPYTDPVNGASFYVVDPWGTAVGYIGDSRRVMHNRGGFDIFSAGPDRKTGQDIIHQEAPNLAYDGIDNDGDGVVDNYTELGSAKFNGCLTVASGDIQVPLEALDDINNWDSAGK